MAQTTKSTARKTTSKGATDVSKNLKDLVKLRADEADLRAQRKRLVRQIDLVASGESVLTEQRRWNTSPPPLRAQTRHEP